MLLSESETRTINYKRPGEIPFSKVHTVLTGAVDRRKSFDLTIKGYVDDPKYEIRQTYRFDFEREFLIFTGWELAMSYAT